MKTLAAVVLAVVAAAGLAAQSHSHVMAQVSDAQWGPAPPFVPAGAQIAVLSGDPTKSVPYAVRLKFPAGYAIPAHSHPMDENVVIVSGAVTFGAGDKLVKSAATNKTLTVGGYMLVGAGMNHYAFTAQESTIVLYGTGPVDFKYVNPADDPRNATKTTSK